MTYRPDWDVDRARGEEAEALYRALRSEILSGEAEVKRDDRASETGNFYVEYRQRRRDGWHPSGLSITQAKTWVIYVHPVLLAVPVVTMKEICRERWLVGDLRECVVGSHPTKGVVIPLAELLPAAIRVPTAAEGAPTDEPPPPAPADTDSDIQTPAFGDPDHPDTLRLPTTPGQCQEFTATGTFTPHPDGWLLPRPRSAA